MYIDQPSPTYACLFCRGFLGSNEHVEHCSAGRRLAFDSGKGRLWIVCPECGGWNLAPLDTRWEAIEECVRLFERTSVRVCTENIGLAVIYGSLDLIRIGRPFRQELAVWRYADELRGRRRRALLKVGANAADSYGWMIGAGGLLGAGVALLVGAPAAIGVGMVAGAGTEELWRGMGPERIEKLMGKVIAKVRINTLDFSFVRTGHLPDVRLNTVDRDWRFELPHSVGWEGYTEDQAINVMGLVLPVANGFGASQTQVVDAVRELDKVGDARAYIESVANRVRRSELKEKGIGQYPMHVRLALEMAAHEETEREALRGRLRWLERRWRQAEEIAEIADNLFTMPAIACSSASDSRPNA